MRFTSQYLESLPILNDSDDETDWPRAGPASRMSESNDYFKLIFFYSRIRLNKKNFHRCNHILKIDELVGCGK